MPRFLHLLISGWMHSKKRNRLGQGLVERLVRGHANMILEEALHEWRATTFPWEDEMIITDPDDSDDSDAFV